MDTQHLPIRIATADLLSSSPRKVALTAKLLHALRDLEIDRADRGDMMTWCDNGNMRHPEDLLAIPLGCHDGVDYYVDYKGLGPQSLNCVDERWRREVVDSLVDVRVVYADSALGSSRAVPVGQIVASKAGFSSFSQSRWIILHDSEDNLWACYANDISELDAVLPRHGVPATIYTYSGLDNNAFNATKEAGESVVYLGKVADQAYAQGTPLNSIRVFKAQWSTVTAQALNNGDIGHSMALILFQTLRPVNFKARGIQRPQYSDKVCNFYHVAITLRHRCCCADLNDCNRPKILDRRSTEAAFLNTLLGEYAAWDAKDLTKTHPGKEVEQK